MTNILTNDQPIINGPTLTGTTNAAEIQFENPHTPLAPADGLTYWDATNRTLATILDNADGVTLQHGQEMHIRCVNKTGVTITDGQVVYISGAQGNRPTATLAKADAYNTSLVIGVATQNIINNDYGFVTALGVVNGYNTSSFTEGDVLYLSETTAGALTKVAPSSPNYMVPVATALNSTVSGAIFVNPARALALDTSFTSPTNLLAPSQSAVKAYAAPINAASVTGTWTFSGPVKITDSTASTSTTTGALVIIGGVGVGGAIYATGGAFYSTVAGTPVPNLKIGYASGTDYIVGRNSSTGFLEFVGNEATFSGYLFSTTAASGCFKIDNAGTPTFTNAIIVTGNTGAAAGSVSYGSGGGFTIYGKTGSTYDVSILNGSGTHTIDVPTGTTNTLFQGIIRTKVYTVSTLPTGAAGYRAFVTDANSTTFASIVAGGGANGVPVYSDGTNWRIG